MSQLERETQTWLVSLVTVLLMVVPTISHAADAGVSAKKLILLDKVATAGKAKAVYVAKNDTGIQKGAAGDPTLLAGSFGWFYETDGATSVAGCFTQIHETDERNRWIKNTDSVAKYVSKDAPISGLPTSAKVVVVKPEKVAKIVAVGLGDFGVGPANLFLGAPTAAEGIHTVLTVENGNDSSTHRMCTQFAADLGSTVVMKEIAGGTGRKLIAKNGVPAACLGFGCNP
jgi:hypothetical protein